MKQPVISDYFISQRLTAMLTVLITSGMAMHSFRGFTIIELMITLAVLAVAIAITAPSFTSILRDTRISTVTSELQGALQLARAEAIKRRATITVCKSNAAQTACNAGNNWDTGWLMMNGATVLKVWAPASGVVITGPNNPFVFQSNGMANEPQNTAVSSSYCTGTQKRTISVTRTGNVSSEKGAC